MSVRKFNTEAVAKKDQFEYWNDAICNTFTSLNSEPSDKSNVSDKGLGYAARLENWNLGEIQIAQVNADPANVAHASTHVAASCEEVDLVHFQVSGSSVNAQDGRESLLQPGDFTICNSSRPYSLFFDDSIEMLVIRTPRAITKKYFNNNQSIYGFHFKTTNQFSSGQLFSNYLQNLWQHRSSEWNHAQLASVSNSALSLMACHLDSYDTLGTIIDGRSDQGVFSSIQLFIDNNIAKPELSPELIAAAHNISTRCLRSKFSANNLKCSKYILDRRLKAAKIYLTEESYSSLKIIEIAFLCGFKNASYFSSRFRDKYGISPKEYRSINIP